MCILNFVACEKPHWNGDGYCDDVNNHAGCNYDDGDCCGDNVNTYWCSVCECITAETAVDPNSKL